MLNFFYTLTVFPIEQIIDLLFVFAFKTSKSPGISVIGLSIAVNTLILPIYLLAEKQQQAEREKQKLMKAEIDNIKAVFKGDKRFMMLSTLYRQYNYHPAFALRNSIDLFIQIPFFIAAYHFISNLEVLNGQTFLFIKDLSAPDGLLNGINLLPFIMTAFNCASGALYTKGLSFRDKVQTYGIAIIFLILLYNSPSALVLYWTFNNIYSFIKNVLIKAKNSKRIVTILVSTVLLFLMTYLLFFQSGSAKKRLFVAFVLLIIFVFSLLHKHIIHKVKKFVAFEKVFSITDFKPVLFSCIVLCILTGLSIPSALIASSIMDFSFGEIIQNPLGHILNAFFQAFGIFIIWIPFIYFLAGKKIRLFLTFLLPIFCFTSLLNTFVFKGDYGNITNLLILSNEDNLNGLFIPSLLVNIIVSITTVSLLFFPRKFLLLSIQIISLIACIFFSSSNFISIHKEFNLLKNYQPDRKKIIAPQAEYVLSKTGKNVVLVMLDRAFSGFFPYIFDERPDLRETLSGFIFYPNTVSYMGHTIMGAPPVFGGYEYTPAIMNERNNVSLIEKNSEAILLLPTLLMNIGFSSGITDPVMPHHAYPELSIFKNLPNAHTENIVTSKKYVPWWQSTNSTKRSTINVEKILSTKLLKFSFFRASPPSIRFFIYDNGHYISSWDEVSIPLEAFSAYVSLDILSEITFVDDNSFNTYTCIYNDFPHQPIFLQFPEYDISKKITNIGNSPISRNKIYHSTISSILLLSKWVDYLKQNDVYNNTRIIFVADHGIPYGMTDIKLFNTLLPTGDLLNGFMPLLMFKDFNSAGSLTTDNTFMTNADVPFLVLKDIIMDPVNPFTNRPMVPDKDNGVIITTSHKWNSGDHGRFEFNIKPDEWLHVRDNIFDIANWKTAEINK